MKFATLAAGLLLSTLASNPLLAHEFEHGTLTINHPWARPTPPGLTVSAVYFSVKNHGNTADRLIGWSSPVAGRTELHESRMDGGMARMRPVESVTIPAQGTIKAEPGGLHVMLLDLSSRSKSARKSR
ncbi:MAG: copper chaperone PCu(A)C [Steroidobacteraceae bacterium]